MSAGRIVWRELNTPDLEATGSFYSSVFGWSLNTVDMGFPYLMMHNDTVDEDVAGAMNPGVEGVPSHWLDYITVDDIDATRAKIIELGGTAFTEVMEAPGVGRFATVADPSGAVFGILASEDPGATDTERRPPEHTFCWSQLMVDNLDAVVPFYSQVFGWEPAPMGEGMVVFKEGEAMRCSAMQQPAASSAPNHWLKYVAVDEVQPALDKATAAGATVHMPPTTMPGMGDFAVIADPTGAVFALWKDLGASQ